MFDSEAVTKALYAVISKPSGKRNWDKIRPLYHEKATLTRTGTPFSVTAAEQCMSLDTYIENIEADLKGVTFSEVELSHQCIAFGQIAHVISVYETQFHTKERTETTRGVNFIQFAQLDGIWRIQSIVWDNESEHLKLPISWLAA